MIVKTRIFSALVAGILVAGLALVADEAPAQEQGEGDSCSAGIARSPKNGPGDAQEVEAFFDELIAKQLRKEHVAGATVAVVKDGRLVFAKGYGYADREQHEPVVADRTLFYPGRPANCSPGRRSCSWSKRASWI